MGVENFEKIAQVFAEAIQKGTASVVTSSTGPARMYVTDSDNLAKIAAEAGIPVEEVQAGRKALGEVLTAHGAGASLEAFIEAVRKGDEGDAVSDDELRRRFELGSELFDTAPLRQQIWNKYTSKNPIFHRLDWEVLIKRADDDYHRPEGEPEPFATVQLKTVTKGARGEFSEDVTTFIVDATDLAPILEGFSRLRDELKGDADG